MKLATVITAVLLPFGSAAAFGPNGKKYNVLYFLADDLRPEIAG